MKISLEKLLDLHKTAIFNQNDIYYVEENEAFKNRLNTQAKKVKQALFQLVQLKEKTVFPSEVR